MPNWVRNRVSITGSKENLNKLWERLVKGAEDRKGLLETFKPLPEVLRSYSTGGARDWQTGESLSVWKDTPKGAQAIPPEELAQLIAEHGTASWYDWAWTNWGVKWDSTLMLENVEDQGIYIERNARSISFDWDAAWSYPEPIYQMIANEYKAHVSVRLSGEWDGEPRVSFDPVDE